MVNNYFKLINDFSFKILGFQTWRVFWHANENPIYWKCFSLTLKKSYTMRENSLPSITSVSSSKIVELRSEKLQNAKFEETQGTQ